MQSLNSIDSRLRAPRKMATISNKPYLPRGLKKHSRRNRHDYEWFISDLDKNGHPTYEKTKRKYPLRKKK